MESNGITIEPLDKQEDLTITSAMILESAKHYVPIENDEQYIQLGKDLAEAKQFIKYTEKSCRPRIKQVADLKASLLADMNGIISCAKQAIPILSGLLVEYDNKLEKVRREEQARIEHERIKKEADAREREEERKLKTASELEKEGRMEEADAVLNQPDRIDPEPENVATVPEKTKVAGLSYREKWKAEQTADIEDVDYRFVKMLFDQEMANAYAKSNKSGAKAKGIRFYCEKIAVNRS